MKFMKYLSGRLLGMFMVIFIGVTFMFFIPRFFPSDPGGEHDSKYSLQDEP